MTYYRCSSTYAPPATSSTDYSPVAVVVVALGPEGVLVVEFVVVVVFIRDEDEEEEFCSVAVVLPVGNGIPLSHHHNVT